MASSNSSNFTPVPGRLFGWGSGKPKSALPGATTVDKQQHVCFPEQLMRRKLFHQVSADTGGVFAALDSDLQLWVWGTGASGRSNFPEIPTVADAKTKFSCCAVTESSVFAIESESGCLIEFTAGTGGKFVERTEVGEDQLFSLSSSSPGAGGAKSSLDAASPGAAKLIRVKDLSACGTNCLVIADILVQEQAEQRCVAFFRDKPASSRSAAWRCLSRWIDADARLVSAGSRHFAVVDVKNRLWTWGMNRNGNLGLGKRHTGKNSFVESPVEVTKDVDGVSTPWFDEDPSNAIVRIDCTRGQPMPKNDFPDPTGQEGPRLHVVTADGKLHIAGTCHKGLGACHLFKVMTSREDHLRPYEVGSVAQDGVQLFLRGGGCFTGAFEDGLFVQHSGMNTGGVVPALDTAVLRRAGIDVRRAAGINIEEVVDAVAHEQAHENQRDHHDDVPLSQEQAPTAPSLLTPAEDKEEGDVDERPQRPPLQQTERQTLKVFFTDHPGDAAVRTRYLDGVRIIGSAPTHIHSFAFSENGQMFGWGCGSDGRLGLRAFFNKSGSKRLMKCYVSTPTQIEALEGESCRLRQVLEFRDC
ncbi:unnamed protein product [Amoebophrya sp. A120]|nr:unnamed protein product [Amoebophrya sp. A120]|eukprot:GSA120T00020048001.1